MQLPDLPVVSVIEDIRQALALNHVILSAPPGSGKSTLIPLLLNDEPWLQGKKIIMLEPRRIAARACAARMSSLLHQEVGNTVGYQTRFERKISNQTNIEVLTEGLFVRRIQNDPELTDVGLVIFDEFHERNMDSDLSLSLCLDVIDSLRADLRLMLMSATLDVMSLQALLKDAAHIQCEGKSYPVEIAYLHDDRYKSLKQLMMQGVANVLPKTSSDILVFLPSTGLIKQLNAQLSEEYPELCIVNLYGELSPEQQDKALLVTDSGQKKIILATDIAETSLTIEGVGCVIDSGLAKKPVFNANTGLTRLDTILISQASAIQRAGRAGRLQAGYCLRLWTKPSHASRKKATAAEILEADLSSLILSLLQWGVSDPSEMCWVDEPPRGHWLQAQSLLRQLGALDDTNRLSALGNKIANFPVHPRLAALMLLAKQCSCTQTGIIVAALLSERDVFERQYALQVGSDINARISAIRQPKNQSNIQQHRLYRVQQAMKQFGRIMGDSANDKAKDSSEILLTVYADRVAKRKQGHCYQLANGQHACLHEQDPLNVSEYLVVCDLDAGKRQGKIFSAVAVSKKQIVQQLDSRIQSGETLVWDEKLERLNASQQQKLGAIILTEQQHKPSELALIHQFWINYVRHRGLTVLNLSAPVQQLIRKVETIRQFIPLSDFRDFSETALLEHLEEWWQPWLEDKLTLKQIRELDYMEIFQQYLGWQQYHQLQTLLPESYIVPSGSKRRIDYAENGEPVLSARLQELFGLMETPRICDGKIPLTIHILSPAQRPVQITKDIANFWKNTYRDVKKDLKGRYPKHYWPDDPFDAQAIKGIKRK